MKLFLRRRTLLHLRSLISILVSAQMVLLPIAASSQSLNSPSSVHRSKPQGILSTQDQDSSPISAEERAQLAQALQTAYWGSLDQEMPWLTEFALGEPILKDGDFWEIQNGNPLLDANPFFMRSQEWVSESESDILREEANGDQQSTDEDRALRAYFKKTKQGHLVLGLKGIDKQLKISEKFTPLLETPEYVLFSADNRKLFIEKNPDDQNPGEGLFYIAKKDFAPSAQVEAPLPVFYFPLPGPGWTNLKHSFEWIMTDQIVVYDQSRQALPIDRVDFGILEEVSRKNLILARAWSTLEGLENDGGKNLPLPNTTAGFGLFLSGQSPDLSKKSDHASASLKSPHNSTINYSSFFGKAQALASSLFAQILPQAHAAEESDEAKNTMLEKLRAKFRRGGESGLKQNLPPSVPVEPTTNGNSNGTNKSNLKQWAVVGALYGGTGLAAFGMAHDIDWRGLITSDMTDRVKIVAGMMGAVFVGSVVLKYTLYRETFKKQYPYEKESSLLTKINAEHKGILDIFTHSLWFSMSIIPQGIRHVLHYLKTRFIPDNKIIEKMWDATMGYQMRQNAHLAMNYKTFYLGAIVLGMSDSLLVAVDLLIIFPWLLQNFGIEVAAGGATAAFVSAEILRNFLSYLQSGAHNYSSEVKMINLMAVEKEVRRQMTAEGINVNLPRNRPEINRRVDLLMEKRFKNYGLPGSDQFRFDPISFIEHWSEYLGFRIPPNHEFKNGEHPARLALKRVLALAEEAQSRSPSDLGAQTVTALEKASDDKHDLKQGDWGLTSQVLKNALLLAEQDQKASPSEIGAHTVATLKKAVQDQFVFRRSHWGLARPVVKRALALAEEAQKIAPSAVGEQTVAALKRATHSLSMIKAGAYGLVKTVTNKQDWADFASTIRDEMEEAKNQGHNTSYDHLKAVLKGTLKALVANSTKDVRAIRNVLFLATVSTEIEGYREYMPKSWVEMAGSKEAAFAATKLFHRAFFATYEHKLEGLRIEEEWVQEFGALAAQELNQESSTDPDLRDPFIYQLNLQERVYSLKKRADEEKKIMEYEPPKESFFARMQWQRAQRRAQQTAGALQSNESFQQAWRTIGQDYQNAFEVPMDVEKTEARWRLSQQIGRGIGLRTEDPDKSPFIQKIIVEANQRTESHLSLEHEKAYMSRLEEPERIIHEAKIFSGHFFEAYVEHSVHSHDHLTASSPEYPGRFQFLRRALVGKPGEKFVSGVIRVVEAMFRNEDTSYRPGLISWLDRSVPVLPDAIFNSGRILRTMPYALAFGWATSYYVWQIPMHFIMYALLFSSGAPHMAIVEFNNRLMKNYGIKPMDDVASKLTYAWVHSRGTNTVLAGLQSNAEIATESFDKYVTDPIHRNILEPIGGFIGSCRQTLRDMSGKHP